MFLIGQSQARTVYGGYWNFVQAKRFQRRIFFRNWPITNKNCMTIMFINGPGRNEQSL